MKIGKITIDINAKLASAHIEYNHDCDDYVLDIPTWITREELVTLVDELKRITEWEE